MNRAEIVKQIEESGIIAVIRLSDTEKLNKIITALSKGGVKALEITMTTPNAVDIIKEVSKEIGGDFLVGAGTDGTSDEDHSVGNPGLFLPIRHGRI